MASLLPLGIAAVMFAVFNLELWQDFRSSTHNNTKEQ